jgi:hypothetical protein
MQDACSRFLLGVSVARHECSQVRIVFFPLRSSCRSDCSVSARDFARVFLLSATEPMIPTIGLRFSVRARPVTLLPNFSAACSVSSLLCRFSFSSAVRRFILDCSCSSLTLPPSLDSAGSSLVSYARQGFFARWTHVSAIRATGPLLVLCLLEAESTGQDTACTPIFAL